MSEREARSELWWEQRDEFLKAYFNKVFWYRLSQLQELLQAYPWLGLAEYARTNQIGAVMPIGEEG